MQTRHIKVIPNPTQLECHTLTIQSPAVQSKRHRPGTESLFNKRSGVIPTGQQGAQSPSSREC